MKITNFWTKGYVILLFLSFSACSTAQRTIFYQIDNLGKIEEKTIDRELWENEIAPGEPLKSSTIVQSDLASYHLVQIRGEEERHRHDYHDVAIFFQSGNGLMFLGDKSFRVKQGAVIFVRHGVPHYFMNGGVTPAVAIMVYSPPYDKKDYIPVPEKKAEEQK